MPHELTDTDIPAPQARICDDRALIERAPGHGVPGELQGWRERFAHWRNARLADSRFQRWARRNPMTRFMARRRARGLFDLCSGFVYSQVLSSCVQLQLFPLLKAGPMGLDDIARAIDLPPAQCDILLRSATSLKLLEQCRENRYMLGIHGAALLANPGVCTMIEHHAFFYRDLSDPVALLQQASPDSLLSRFWDYTSAHDSQADSVGPARPYTELMAASQSMIAEQIIDCYPLHEHQRLLDVGGGDGSFLRAVAASAPDLALNLFDLPAVIEQARERFTRARLPNTVDCTAGNALHDALPVGADIISLVRVVHDHDEAEARTLLRAALQALPPGGTLLLAEPMARSRVGDPATDAYFGFYLHAMGRGRPRTADELGHLIEQVGFVRVRALKTQMPMLVSVLVARAP